MPINVNMGVSALQCQVEKHISYRNPVMLLLLVLEVVKLRVESCIKMQVLNELVYSLSKS